jgi:hypothetical protein
MAEKLIANMWANLPQRGAQYAVQSSETGPVGRLVMEVQELYLEHGYSVAKNGQHRPLHVMVWVDEDDG